MFVVSTAIALVLYALFALPAIWAWRSHTTHAAGWLAGAIALLAIIQTGLFGGTSEIPVLSQVSQDQMKAGKCEEMFALMVENRLLLEQPADGKLVASKALWQEMPEVVRNTAMSCAQADDTANPTGGQIEIILR